MQCVWYSLQRGKQGVDGIWDYVAAVMPEGVMNGGGKSKRMQVLECVCQAHGTGNFGQRPPTQTDGIMLFRDVLYIYIYMEYTAPITPA
jgi:hypothetical protein